MDQCRNPKKNTRINVFNFSKKFSILTSRKNKFGWGKMDRGRPSVKDQQKIKSAILEYYERDISARATARECNVQEKTVCKYYKKWDNEIIDEKDFLTRIKNTKERAIESFDRDVITLDKDKRKIEFLIEKFLQKASVSEFEKLMKVKLKVIDQRTKITSAKVNLVGTPTADVLINGEIMA